MLLDTKTPTLFAATWAATAASLLFLFCAGSSAAGEEFVCPAAANDGTNVSVQFIAENRQCSAQSVRVISSIVGNANNTLAGLGVYGPAVAESLLIVPAGTNPFCGCNAGTCACGGGSCTVDGDCQFCSATTPGVLNTVISAEPALPAELTGTVATLIFLTESESPTGEVEMSVNECFVEVL